MLSPRTVRALLVVLAFVCAFALRTAFSYRTVFRGGDVVFQDPDAAFHVRTVQNLVRHFPYRSGFDPYSGFPRGQNVDTGPSRTVLSTRGTYSGGSFGQSARVVLP